MTCFRKIWQACVCNGVKGATWRARQNKCGCIAARKERHNTV